MIWLDDTLKSPLSGAILKRDSPHSFSDRETRFPIVAEIPFLRTNRDDLRRAALGKLDAGDERGALVLLLQDRDDWARDEPPTKEDLQSLLDIDDPSLRTAMRHLKYGAVADYFAYRWSDPTFLSGLCLLDAHLPADAEKICELCCGIGHYLREFDLRGIEATGADVVFSKLWLARKFVAPNAKLVCFDANADFPFADRVFDAAFCHDAFYFLPEKQRVAAELQRTTRGTILIGHAHNAEAENFSSGAAIPTAEYAAMFENPILYDDAELTAAFIENRAPNAQKVERLKKTEAVAIAARGYKTDDAAKKFGLPPANRRLRVNPLLDAESSRIADAPKYPSQRYAKEYAGLSDYLSLKDEKISTAERETVLGGDWRTNARLTSLVRRRIFLDLPENW